MPRPWLLFLTIGTATTIVFVFFFLQLRPIKPPATTGDETAASETLDQPTVTFVNPSTGAENPTVTIVEFGDFQCDACKDLSENIKTAMRSYPDDVRLVWKDMPNESAHPLSTSAAVAAHCADRQGKFWEYHDLLFDRQTYLTENEFATIASDAGLDTSAFGRCYDSQDTLAGVRKDFEEGQALGILATPTIFIGTDSYAGALSVDQLSRLIQQALAH